MVVVSKRKFIHDCLEKLEDLNEYQIKGGDMASTGQYSIADFVYNILPILKDLITANINLEIKIGQLEDQIDDFVENIERVTELKIGGTDPD
jgi:hypothetical protein